MENKAWWKSLTILSILVCITCLMIVPLTIAKPLREGFTLDELCAWAVIVSQNQKLSFLVMVALTAAMTAIYGRLRAVKGIGKDEK